MTDKIKQTIIVRKDLNMRRGKTASQVAHASMIFLSRRLIFLHAFNIDTDSEFGMYNLRLSGPQMDWLNGSFTKVVLGVESEEKLLEIFNLAENAGLEVHKMIDNGDTEFNGQKTLTCIAIGPDYSSKIDPITKDLQLI